MYIWIYYRILVLFNKQRYEFFSKSQLEKATSLLAERCCSISKDTNFSANHNAAVIDVLLQLGVVQ